LQARPFGPSVSRGDPNDEGNHGQYHDSANCAPVNVSSVTSIQTLILAQALFFGSAFRSMSFLYLIWVIHRLYPFVSDGAFFMQGPSGLRSWHRETVNMTAVTMMASSATK
jgi:hypothetical protein